MNQRGMSVQQLTSVSDLSVGTINNVLAGKPTFRGTGAKLAKALESSLAVLMDEAIANDSDRLHEYLLAEVLTNWVHASNGLKFQICRLRHSELDRQARGKRFDLRDLATDEQQRCRTLIKRHPNVCDDLREHPNVIRNLTAFRDPREDFYWVVDEWVDGESLQRTLRHAPLEPPVVRQLLLDIGNGLNALHMKGIVRRELTPASILIRESDGRAILTEFELAKLIDRGPTVSTDDWPVDPYRAGEADSDDIDLRADIYSWARIAIHVLLGTLPQVGEESTVLAGMQLPQAVRECLTRGLAVFRSERPESLEQVLPIIKGWEC